VAVNESSGLIVTNWHVVRDAAGPIVVFFPDGFRSGAYLLRTDRDWDLAALAIWRPSVPPIPLSNEAPRPGEEVTIAGYGSGSYRAVTGRVTQYVSPGGNQPFEMIELSAPARNGDSAGRSSTAAANWPVRSSARPSDAPRAVIAAGSAGSSTRRMATSNASRLKRCWPGNPRRFAAGGSNQLPSPARGEGPGARAVNGAAVAQVPTHSSISVSQTRLSPVASAIPSAPAGPLPTTDQIRSILAFDRRTGHPLHLAAIPRLGGRIVQFVGGDSSRRLGPRKPPDIDGWLSIT